LPDTSTVLPLSLSTSGKSFVFREKIVVYVHGDRRNGDHPEIHDFEIGNGNLGEHRVFVEQENAVRP